MTSATIVGGGTITIGISQAFVPLLQQALATAAGSKAVNIATSMSQGPIAGDYNVYNPVAGPPAGQTFTLPTGADAIILGDNGVIGGLVPAPTLNGHAGAEILAGDISNDTINAKGGYGSIFTDGGSNVVQLNDAGLAGAAQGSMIYLGKGNDTVNMWGGSATVTALGVTTVNLISGNNNVVGTTALKVNATGGADTVTTAASGGSNVSVSGGIDLVLNGNNGDSVSVGTGANTVEAFGGNLNVVTSGSSAVLNLKAAGPSDTVTGNATINLTHANAHTLALNGADTISFGSGDTVSQQGVATISSGPSGITVQAGGGNDSTRVGTQAATLIGGTGSGLTTLVGGSVSNLFVGGAGHDTMTGNNSAIDVFSFNHLTGGIHTIGNFASGTDHIHLVGYGATEAANAITSQVFAGGNTTVNLTDGTRLTLVGYHPLTASDFA
jgi:hypothetical protein